MRRTPGAFLVLYLGLRALLLLQPGYPDDLTAYRRWAVTASRQGLERLYRESDMDYPPLYGYLLLPLGEAYTRLWPGAGTKQGGDQAAWVALAKLPPLAFDLAIAALLWHAGARADRASDPGRPRTLSWRLLLPGAYLANPAVVFDTGYWGHPDSIHSFFVVAALLLVVAGRPASGFASLALGTLMKPLAAPFFPLLAVLAVRRSGAPALLRGALAGLAATLLVFLPFLMSGDAGFVVERVLFDLDAMPYTSVNAHNVWGALGDWRRADAPLLGPLTATQLGLSAFGAVYLAVLFRSFRLFKDGGPMRVDAAAILAASIGGSFFMLATHMHENHLFVVLPLLAVTLPAGPAWRRLYVALSLAVLLNLVLHDPWLPGQWPLTLGGPTGVARPSHGRHYFLAELWAVRGAIAYGLVVFGTFLYTVFWASPLSAGPPSQGKGFGNDAAGSH